MKKEFINIPIKESDLKIIKYLERKLNYTLDYIINIAISRYFIKFKLNTSFRSMRKKYDGLKNEPCDTCRVSLFSSTINNYKEMVDKFCLNKNGLRSNLIHDALREYMKVIL